MLNGLVVATFRLNGAEIHKLARHILSPGHTSGHRAALSLALDQFLSDVAQATLLRTAPEHDHLCQSLRLLWQTALDPQSET